MNREQATLLLKDQLESYLSTKGINTHKNFKCLICEGGNKTPNMSYKNNRIHCFACGADMDIIDLIGHETGKSGTELFNHCYELFNIDIDTDDNYNNRLSKKNLSQERSLTPPSKTSKEITPLKNNTQTQIDYKEFFLQANKALHNSPEALEYLQFRGISTETADRFMLGYDPEWRSPTALKNGKNPPVSQRLIIPTGRNSYLARATDKNIDPAFKAMKEGAADFFNKKALRGSIPVFITEAAIDAISIIEVGGEACALGSTSGVNKFLELCKTEPPTVPLILSLDNDKAGKEAQEKLKAGLKALKISFYEVNTSGKEYKDPNEHLTTDREAFTALVNSDPAEAAQQEAESEKTKYLETAAAYHLNALMGEIAAGANTPAISTGFKLLDKELDGGLYEGLYIIGAISSLGKTTFILQVADQIAQRGHDVLMFSLEMSRYELMAKSISRLTLENCGGEKSKAKTTRGILSGAKRKNYNNAEKELINQSIKDYAEYSKYIYIHEAIGDIGVEDIRHEVQKHISFTGNTPIVIIDYLQIIAPYNTRASDKQNTDKAVLDLKRLSRDKKIPILAISSFNRDNYTAPVNLASFKESGAIEYSSDILLGLQLDGMDNLSQGERNRSQAIKQIEEWKKADPRKAQLKILKNRNGNMGISLYYDYYPMFNTFKEGTGSTEVEKDSNDKRKR